MLLASVPPASMYISPTAFAGGVRCSIQAIAQPIAFSSMHIGSGPGVAGLSAMQVKPLWPRRTVRMPLAPIATIVAPRPIAGGAADIALAIKAESPARGARRWWDWLKAAPPASAATAAVRAISVFKRGIGLLLSKVSDGDAATASERDCNDAPPSLSGAPQVARGRSSAGRALQSHCRGQGFDPPRLHHFLRQ